MHRTLVVILLLLLAGASRSHAVDISGQVTTANGAPVCALVLASGRSMFSCNPVGPFSLTDLPVELDGSVNLQVYAQGFLPYFQKLTEFEPQTVVMQRARRVDSGLSDLSALDGTYALLRFTNYFNDGDILDSSSGGIQTSGVWTIANGVYTFEIILSLGEETVTIRDGGLIEDLGAGIVLSTDGVSPRVEVLLERGSKLITFANLNFSGSLVATAYQWAKVSDEVELRTQESPQSKQLPGQGGNVPEQILHWFDGIGALGD